MTRARIVLAEDHPRVADELRHLLEGSFDVVAVAGHGLTLVTMATRLEPDAIVTDISMPGVDGIQAARDLICLQPTLGVVFVTVHDDPALARKALSIGHAYVLKASAGEDLVDAVHAALAGKAFVSPALASLLRRD